MTIETWPKQAHGGKHPTIITAKAQAAGESQTHYQVVFHDSSGNSLTVQLPDTAFHNLVETGAALLGLQPKPKARNAGTKHSKP